MSGQSTINESISIKLNEAVGSATISPSGRDVCLAARKGLFIVDLDDPWATPRFLPYYSAIVSDVQWSPHPSRAHWVVSTSGNKGLVWNLSASSGSSPIEHVTQGHERSITDMNWAVFQPDTLATCGIDGNVLAYDLRLGGKKPILKYCGWRHGATQVKYNRQNPNELASAHGEYLYIWDDRKGSHPVTTIRAHEQKIYGIDYSRKKKDSIVTCSLDHTVKYWTLNGLETIEEPTQTITTSSPVWRARHTPFGNGLVTLPQRSEFAVKIWAQDRPEKEVWKQSGHSDVVREFLWRTQGGDDPNDDDRTFQLVTWGNDQQLLLTPIPTEVLASVGHVPHSPIEVGQTRRHAANMSYREPTSLPKSGSYPQTSLPGSSTLGHSGPGVSPTTHFGAHSTSNGSSDDHYGRSKMTPGGLHSSQSSTGHYPSNRLPLSTTSRYGRSANSGTSMSSNDAKSPSLGTSPASGHRGLYLHDRKVDSVPSPKIIEHRKSFSQQQMDSKDGAGTFMTRATGRRPGGQDAVTWMEGVRVVSTGQNVQQTNTTASNKADAITGKGKHGQDTHGDYTILPGGQPVQVDKEIVPLHEELTAIARALQSKVRFEKIAIPNRTLVVALYGPWATSGVSTFLRATFTFPLEYPHLPLNIDIERSSGISNKARARILAGVRGLAARYANKSKNSLEECLNCLMGGKVVEPDDLDEEDGDLTHPHGELSNFLVQRLNDGEEEVDEVDSEEDLERLLANRNCPSPRRAGAVFGPTGVLFTFFPLDSVHHPPGSAEERGRSVSPTRSRSRPRRRRLFESFGIITSLQYTTPEDPDDDDELHQNGNDEDSDEVLNIPSLMMATRRGRSHGGSESVGTSNHLNIQLAGTGRAFNSRVYRYDYSTLVSMDIDLVSQYTLQGDLLSIITANSEIVKSRDCGWIIQRAWSTLFDLAEASAASSVKDIPIRALFLGESMPEKVFMDMLDIFFRMGDVQMTGVLACLVELDRRTIQASRPLHSRRFSRSPAHAGAVDYFSLKPTRSSRNSGGAPGTAGSDYRHAVVIPSGLGLPLKSPKDWVISASYGTQGSSAGSSTRGSSWANNLSTFKSGASEKSGFQKAGGRNTPPSVGMLEHRSPASLSPAFVKRSTIGPLSELKKQGGIASGRPHTISGKPKVTTHVSFAATSNAPVQASPLPIQKPASNSGLKIVVRKTNNREPSRPPSLLLHPQVQAQLEYYRLLYAELLHRLQLPHQRVQVLKLTRSVLDGTSKELMRVVSGLAAEPNRNLTLEQSCPACGRSLVGRHPAYCSQCRRKRDPAPCSLCHLPLDDLVETCLACLHSCHLSCLQDWRIDEVVCPAACGCSCADFTVGDTMLASFTETFKSPPFVT